MRAVLIALIRAYQLFISPLLGNHCRFYPSCSQYAREAIERYGVPRGVWLAIRRVLRCHPWCPGGVDPEHGARHGVSESRSACRRDRLRAA